MIDGLVFAVVLVLVALALERGGFLSPQTGTYAAIDGDSLRGSGAEIRLHGIDAPELHQQCFTRAGASYGCGAEARKALSRLVSGKVLACISMDTDRYGRNVARCKAGDIDINAEMVRQGWAMAYRRHSAAYVVDERRAEKAGLGIWQGRFEEPEQWRASHRAGIVQGDIVAGD